MRSPFGFLRVLFIAAVVLLIGGVAYNWGLNAGQAQVAVPGTVVYAVGYGHAFGFGIFGFLFFLVIIGLLISAFRPRPFSGGHGHWGRGMGPGGMGKGGWGKGGWGAGMDPNDPQAREWTPRDVPPPFQPMLEAWHRRAHGDTTAAPGPTGATNAAPTTPAASADAGAGQGPNA